MKATEWLTSDHVTKICEQLKREREQALSKKTRQQLVDNISRSAQVLIAHGDDLEATMKDVRRLNLELAEDEELQDRLKAGCQSHIAGFLGSSQ